MKRNLWSSWSEYLNVRETDALEESPENFAVPTKSDVMKLPYKDKNLFGYCSEYEDFYLVICKVCGKRIKPQSLGFHMELRHKNVSQDIVSLSDSVQETSHLTNVIPSSSREISDKEVRLLKTNSKNWSSSIIKQNTVISNTKHAVYVQPYPKPSSIESCLKNTYGKISSYSSSSGIVRTSLTKSIKSGNHESLTNAYIREIPPPESSLSTCDSQTSMTVFLHHSFLMPNMKLCDIQDQCTDNLKCLNSGTWPQSSCLSEAPILTQIIPEKMIGSPNQSSQIHHLNNEVADWNSEQNGTNLSLNGMTAYSEWNQHSTHFRPLPPDVQMSQGEQMTSHSYNCPDIRKFDDLESQVLIHNATMGT